VERPIGSYRRVSTGYFHAMGMRLLRGRIFADRDRRQPFPAVISEDTARALWPDTEAIGQRFFRGRPQPAYEVVGVVANARLVGLERTTGLVVYVPYWEQPRNAMSLIVRSTAAPDAMVPAVRAAVRSVDPDLPLRNVRTMETVLSRAIATRQFQVTLTLCASIVGLCLVCIGVYAVVAAAVARRRREIAVRLVLGATVQHAVGRMLQEGMVPVLIGLFVGVLGALALGQVLDSLLFEVAPHDPMVLSGVTFSVLTVAMLACLVPAYRAAFTSPTLVLRGD
jgi:putative ABC transport system permease protein